MSEQLRPGQKTHGKVGTRVYKTWSGMIQRCSNKKDAGWRFYGAKGIRVCSSWKKFENFYKDMGDPPTNKHTIDRINSSGNYEHGNCRWATQEQQSKNKCNSVYITFKGETMHIIDWSRKIGVPVNTIYGRHYDGHTIEETLSPARIKKKYCIRGHERVPENLYDGKGCKTCMIASAKERNRKMWAAKKKAKAK